jgi:hypothetical protein
MTAITITLVLILMGLIGSAVYGFKTVQEGVIGVSIIGLIILCFFMCIHLYNIREAYSKSELAKKIYNADYTIDEMYFNSREIMNHEDYKFRYPKEK